MTLTMNGIESRTYSLPGSCPQGVFLGVFFFIVAFNSAFLRQSIQRKSLTNVEEVDAPSDGEKVNEEEDFEAITAKYIDDSSRARSVDLIEDLKKNENPVYPDT